WIIPFFEQLSAERFSDIYDAEFRVQFADSALQCQYGLAQYREVRRQFDAVLVGDAEQVLNRLTQMHLTERDVIVLVPEQLRIFGELFHIDIIRHDPHTGDCPDHTVGIFFHQRDEKGAEIHLHFLCHLANHAEIHECDGFTWQDI